MGKPLPPRSKPGRGGAGHKKKVIKKGTVLTGPRKPKGK